MLTKLKPKSEFSRNVLTLMTGTTIAQAIPIAISPILTRIYTPEDFGVLALFVAITSIFGSIANGRYELAIMLPKKNEDAINIVALGFIINLSLSLVLFLIVIVFHDNILNLFNKEISLWLYLVPISVFLMGLFNLLNYFNNRKKFYKDLAKANVYKSIGMAIVQLSLGFFKAGAFGLISGQIFSQIISNTKLFFNVKGLDLFRKIKKVKIIALGKRYIDFPLHNAPSTFADILTIQLPILLLPKLFDITIIGFFFFAKKIISIPSSLISRSVSQVLLQQLSYNNHHNKQNFPIIKQTIKKMFFIALPITMILFTFGIPLFKFVFGNEWIISGDISRYLSLIFLFQFIASTISISLVAYNKLKILAIWQYIYLFSSLIFFVIAYTVAIDFETFLKYFTIIEIFFYIIYIFMSVGIVYYSDKKLGAM